MEIVFERQTDEVSVKCTRQQCHENRTAKVMFGAEIAEGCLQITGFQAPKDFVEYFQARQVWESREKLKHSCEQVVQEYEGRTSKHVMIEYTVNKERVIIMEDVEGRGKRWSETSWRKLKTQKKDRK